MAKDTIEAVRNLKTGKLFILIDDSHGTVFRVVDPSGKIINLPAALFAEDTAFLSSDDENFAEFTPEQLTIIEDFNARAAQSAENQKRALVAKPASPTPRSPSTTRGGPVKRPRTDKAPANHFRVPPVVWSAGRLTFFRHRIHPLGPRQSFRISVEGVGDFEMTKEDFLVAFNDVVMAPSYRSEGIFTYPEIPEKALRFLKG